MLDCRRRVETAEHTEKLIVHDQRRADVARFERHDFVVAGAHAQILEFRFDAAGRQAAAQQPAAHGLRHAQGLSAPVWRVAVEVGDDPIVEANARDEPCIEDVQLAEHAHQPFGGFSKVRKIAERGWLHGIRLSKSIKPPRMHCSREVQDYSCECRESVNFWIWPGERVQGGRFGLPNARREVQRIVLGAKR